MRLSDLDVRQFVKPTPDGKHSRLIGLAFLCPCCLKEYLVVCFQPTAYETQKELMKNIVTNVEAATWIPYPMDMFHSTVNEENLEKITIRPSIDARAVGHALVTVSHGEVSH